MSNSLSLAEQWETMDLVYNKIIYTVEPRFFKLWGEKIAGVRNNQVTIKYEKKQLTLIKSNCH